MLRDGVRFRNEAWTTLNSNYIIGKALVVILGIPLEGTHGFVKPDYMLFSPLLLRLHSVTE